MNTTDPGSQLVLAQGHAFERFFACADLENPAAAISALVEHSKSRDESEALQLLAKLARVQHNLPLHNGQSQARHTVPSHGISDIPEQASTLQYDSVTVQGRRAVMQAVKAWAEQLADARNADTQLDCYASGSSSMASPSPEDVRAVQAWACDVLSGASVSDSAVPRAAAAAAADASAAMWHALRAGDEDGMARIAATRGLAVRWASWLACAAPCDVAMTPQELEASLRRSALQAKATQQLDTHAALVIAQGGPHWRAARAAAATVAEVQDEHAEQLSEAAEEQPTARLLQQALRYEAAWWGIAAGRCSVALAQHEVVPSWQDGLWVAAACALRLEPVAHSEIVQQHSLHDFADADLVWAGSCMEQPSASTTSTLAMQHASQPGPACNAVQEWVQLLSMLEVRHDAHALHGWDGPWRQLAVASIVCADALAKAAVLEPAASSATTPSTAGHVLHAAIQSVLQTAPDASRTHVSLGISANVASSANLALLRASAVLAVYHARWGVWRGEPGAVAPICQQLVLRLALAGETRSAASVLCAMPPASAIEALAQAVRACDLPLLRERLLQACHVHAPAVLRPAVLRTAALDVQQPAAASVPAALAALGLQGYDVRRVAAVLAVTQAAAISQPFEGQLGGMSDALAVDALAMACAASRTALLRAVARASAPTSPDSPSQDMAVSSLRSEQPSSSPLSAGSLLNDSVMTVHTQAGEPAGAAAEASGAVMVQLLWRGAGGMDPVLDLASLESTAWLGMEDAAGQGASCLDAALRVARVQRVVSEARDWHAWAAAVATASDDSASPAVVAAAWSAVLGRAGSWLGQAAELWDDDDAVIGMPMLSAADLRRCAQHGIVRAARSLIELGQSSVHRAAHARGSKHKVQTAAAVLRTVSAGLSACAAPANVAHLAAANAPDVLSGMQQLLLDVPRVHAVEVAQGAA